MFKSIDLRKVDPEVNYTLDQVRDFLNLSYSSILKLKKNRALGELKRIGRQYYVTGQAILDYVNKKGK